MAFALGTTTGAGTITIAAGSTTVVGVGTAFNALDIGKILVVGSQWGVITAVASATSCTIDRLLTSVVTASAYSLSSTVSTAGTGTISVAANSANVVGTGTSFTSDMINRIIIVGTQFGFIQSVTSSTNITLDRVFTTAVSGATYNFLQTYPIITQTGTDTSLSALSTTAGINNLSLGDGSVFLPLNAQLNLNGTISFNGLLEKLVDNNQIDNSTGGARRDNDIRIAGTLTVNLSTVVNGQTIYAPDFVYWSRRPQPTGGGGGHILNTTGSSFFITSTGRADLTGGTYVVRHNFAVDSGGRFNVVGSHLKGQGSRFWMNAGSITTFVNATIEGFAIFFNAFPTTLSGVTFKNCTTITKEVSPSAGFDAAPNVVLSPQWLATASPIVNIWGGSWLRVKNSTGGSSLGVLNTAPTPWASGIADFVQDVQFRVKNLAGSSVTDFKFSAIESNDGNRRNVRQYTGVGPFYDNTDIRTLNWTSAAGGLTNTIEARLQAGVTTLTPTTTPGSGGLVTTNFGQTANDEYDVFGCGYGYLLYQKRIQFRANGVLIVDETILPNTSITEFNPTLVAAYTTLNTNAQLYDYAAYYLFLNYARQTEFYVLRSGNVINAGDYNVIIDATASVPFAISGNTLTIKSSIFTGNITTTGNITLLNGAKFSNNVITATNIYQNTPVIVDSVIMNANLIYNINSNVNVNFLTTQVSGTVSNLGTGNVLISLLNSTIGTAGTRVTTRLITSFIINGLTDGSQVYVADNLGNQVEYIPNSSTSYTLNTTGGTGVWSYKVTRYGFLAQTGTFTPAVSSTTTTFTSIPDTNITEPDILVVADYTTLFFTDQMYDYSAYFETTNVGIKLPRLAGKLLGYVDFGSYDLVFSPTSATLEILGNTITLNIIDLFTGTIFDTGVITTATIDVGTANIVYPLLLSSSAGQNYWLNITLPTASSIYIANGSGVQQQYIASSGTSFIYGLPAGTVGDWTLSLAKYGFISQTSIFTPSVGGVVDKAVSFIPDSFVVDTLANVIAYTDLNSGQKITDYASYFGTTNTGIIIGPVLSKGFGTLTVPAGLTLNPNAVVLFVVSSGVVTTKSSGLAEIITIISTGNFIQGTATLSNDVLIRAANFDSEIVFNADSITFYPTLIDRNAGTNPGVTTTGGIYRYKYGSTYSGVTMIGTLYTRVVQGGITFFFDKEIIIGNNIVDLSTQGQLSALNSKIELVPQEVWYYENRTLNNELFE